jgi:hypothetical protein
MDIESPEHLERLRDQPEVKAALLRKRPVADASECRFERNTKNNAYWPPIEDSAAGVLASARVEEACRALTIYGRPCWLIVTALNPVGPYAIAVTAADGASVEDLVALLRKVTEHYWFGSSFFK